MTSTSAAAAPEPGSLGDRILQLFKRNHADETFAAQELTRKFDVALPAVWAAVEPLERAGVLKKDASIKAATTVISRGPNFPLPPPVAQEVRPAKKAGRKVGSELPPLDLDKLVVRTGVPKPPRFMPTRPGESKYDGLFAKLTKPGQSIDLPVAYQKSLAPMVMRRSKAGPAKFSMRRTAADTVTLWRDA